MTDASHLEQRVLILAPRGRDAQVIADTLTRDKLAHAICADYEALTAALSEGAGAAIVADEALVGADLTTLIGWLDAQESWSDFPFVVLSSKRPAQRAGSLLNSLERLINLVVLERPVHADTLVRAIRSALRARRRQYQARSYLQDRMRSEEHLRLALNAGRLGSWNIELDTGTLILSDTCKMHFGYPADADFTYEDLMDAVHQEDRDRHEQVIREAIRTQEDFNIEYRVVWPNGSVHWVHVRGQTLRSLNGRPLRMAGVSQDVTDRREAEDRLINSQNALQQLNETLEVRIGERTSELAQANDKLMKEMAERERTQMALMQAQKMEAIGRLTGGIAHDFNNLLNVIIGNVDLIERLSTDERIKRMSNSARSATKRGAKLTGQLLAFSRNQSLDLKSVSIETLIDGMKDLIAVSVGSNIRVDFDIPAELPHAMADANQLEMAILNLAINARDAMPDGGTLRLRCRMRRIDDGILKPGDYLVVAVTDNGTGIGQDILGKVFDPFFTTKAVGKGTGLGLSQVYGIANQSGGLARIDSVVGRGTTVEVWLPAASGEAMAQAAAEPAEGALEATASGNILVIEDDPEVRHFIVECLEILGYTVEQAENGWFGLEKLHAGRPDLLIVDFLMPGINGAEVIGAARAQYPDLPVIIATGYADMRALEKVISLDAVLRKPFQLSDLAASVKRALHAAAPTA